MGFNYQIVDFFCSPMYLQPSQPSSTFEGSADKVSFRPQMNEPSPEVWQQVAAEWDCAQSRPRIDKPVEATPVNARPSRLLPRRQNILYYVAKNASY